MLSDTSCLTCSRPADVYRMGVSNYAPGPGETADGILSNNINGSYHYYPYTGLSWVPYDNGYYAELRTKAAGEFWFNNGGVTGHLPANTVALDFRAVKLNETEAQLSWQAAIDTEVLSYTLLRSTDSLSFDTLGTTAAVHNTEHRYTELDAPAVSYGQTVYYRLLYMLNNGKKGLSVLRAVDWIKGGQLLEVYPVPSDGLLHIHWTGTPGQLAALQLSDVTGRTVYRQELHAADWDNDQVLQLGGLPRGLYFLKMNIAGNSFTTKVLFR